MNHHEALRRIEAIETALSRASWFRGYRSRLVLCSAITCLIGVLLQSAVLPQGAGSEFAYVRYWGTIAILNLVGAGFVMLWQQRPTTATDRRLAQAAIMAIAPSLVAGAGVTAAIVESAPTLIWALPGLWSVLFGLGVCASQFVLPKPTLLTGGYFLLSGLALLWWGPRPLNGVEMVITFGIGQTLSAIVLYWTLERSERTSGVRS